MNFLLLRVLEHHSFLKTSICIQWRMKKLNLIFEAEMSHIGRRTLKPIQCVVVNWTPDYLLQGKRHGISKII